MEENEFVQGFLYTSKEMKMHVDGPKRLCDLTYLKNMTINNELCEGDMENFVNSGFFCKDNIVPPEFIRKARAYINGEYTRWLKISRRQDDWRIHLLVDLKCLDCEPVEHAPLLDLLLQSPNLLTVLEALMGSKPSGIFYNQVAYRTPLVNPKPSIMDYSVGAEYHIDGQANCFGTRFPDPWSVLVGIALVDIESLDMGNFTVFPGTHRSVNWANYPAEKRNKTLPSLGDPFKVCLKAGSAVLAHVLLPHRGGKNILAEGHPHLQNIDYNELPNIPKATREMVFFRIQASHIDYRNPHRSMKLLKSPMSEHHHLLNKLIGAAKLRGSSEDSEDVQHWSALIVAE